MNLRKARSRGQAHPDRGEPGIHLVGGVEKGSEGRADLYVLDEDQDEVWDENEKIAYYVYTVVEEDVPDGYTVSYDFYNPIDAGDYELTVTNKLNIPLPDTGAGGDAMFVAVGVGILLLGLTLTKRRRPRKGER